MLVKRWVPEDLQERLWEHTRRIREEREHHRANLMLEEERRDLQLRRIKPLRKKSEGVEKR